MKALLPALNSPTTTSRNSSSSCSIERSSGAMFSSLAPKRIRLVAQVVEDAPLLADDFLLSRIDEPFQRHRASRPCRMHAIRLRRGQSRRRMACAIRPTSARIGRMRRACSSLILALAQAPASSCADLRTSRRSRRPRTTPSRSAAAPCMSRRASVATSTRCAGRMGEPVQYKRTGITARSKATDAPSSTSTKSPTRDSRSPLVFYLDAYHFDDALKAPKGFTCAVPIALSAPPPDALAGGGKPAAAGDRTGRGEGLRADLARRRRQRRARGAARSLPR